MQRVVFWGSIALVFYAYAGYGACLAVLAKIRPRPPRLGTDKPSVSLIIPCYNEAAYVRAKLDNSLALAYPKDRLEIIVISSGSDDGTEKIVAEYAEQGVRCIAELVRAGKEAAMQRAARDARGEILVFTDANAWLPPEAMERMARWFSDSDVGCVSGEKRLEQSADARAGRGEGAYWRYESALKKLDSRVGSTMGAAGELIAMRAELMSYRETDNIIEDFMLSMRVVEVGYRVVYEPDAYATEEASQRMEDLFERRARIAAGGFQSILRLRRMLDPRRGVVWWQYVSHRVLRWALVPFLLPLIFALNVSLARTRGVYRGLLGAQTAFYLAALIGWRTQRSRIGRFPAVYYPFFFSTVNAAALVGCARLLSGRQSVLWKKTRP